jgi:hypothetical protein
VPCHCWACRAGRCGGRTPGSSYCATISLSPGASGRGLIPADVAGPGVACPASRDAADRPPRRDAADRHPGQHLAVAPGHRPPPVVAPVTPGPAGTPGNAPEGPVGGATACPGERVVGVTAASTASWPWSVMSVRPADELPDARQHKRPVANGKHGRLCPCLLPALPGRDPLHIEQPGLPQGADHELYPFLRIPGQPEALRRRHATIR